MSDMDPAESGALEDEDDAAERGESSQDAVESGALDDEGATAENSTD
jgi:hypothetical protein